MVVYIVKSFMKIFSTVLNVKSGHNFNIKNFEVA